ncbi:MAG: hypothetical protein AABY84_10895 [Candidatus Firestonebacteria bacterium]
MYKWEKGIYWFVIVMIIGLFTGGCRREEVERLAIENSSLKIENANLKKEVIIIRKQLEPYLKAQMVFNKKISQDPAYAKLTQYEYEDIKFVFENAPMVIRILIVKKMPEINSYADFLDMSLNKQINAMKKFFYTWLGENMNEDMLIYVLQKQFSPYLDGALAKKIAKYK